MFFITFGVSCHNKKEDTGAIRNLVDTIGFVQYAWQMDSIMSRIEEMYMFEEYHPCDDKSEEPAKIVISPHDDYTYVGPLYPAVIHEIKSNVVIMFGVAHKARQFGLENKLIFESNNSWKGPYKNVQVSELRNEIISALDTGMFVINDSIQAVEHSLEALLPYLQYFNKKFEIVPILVPAMSFKRINQISDSLARVISTIADKHNLKWGKDFAFIISNDAVHYGDADWGGQNLAPFGSDTAGYLEAISHEMEITSTLCGKLNPDSIKRFNEFTVDTANFREYRWTWCGRYSVPLGLMTGHYLAEINGDSICGTKTGYLTSIDHPPVPVSDLGMGTTAPANLRHWVGYVGIIYK